jgi:hypothetical protein
MLCQWLWVKCLYIILYAMTLGALWVKCLYIILYAMTLGATGDRSQCCLMLSRMQGLVVDIS